MCSWIVLWRRKARAGSLLLLVCVSFISAATTGTSAENRPIQSKPNILLIVADDLGFSDLGCYGGEIATPNLDKLAANGVRFTQFYNTARCWPTRAALMTGYYPQQIRMDPQKGRCPDWARALPTMLRPLGYRSYHSGKWHVSGIPRTCADAGFDHSYRLEDHDRNFNPRNLIEDDQKLPPITPGSGYYTATAIADHLIKYLKEHSSRAAGTPFFGYLAFTVPHFPLQAPSADIERYKDKYMTGWDSVRQARLERQRKLGLPRWTLSPTEPQIRAPSGKPGVEKEIDPGEIAFALPWASLTAEQQRFQASKMAIHAAMVDRMDQEIGRVLSQVQEMGELDNTVVFFLSDNGASAEILLRGDGHNRAAEKGSAESFLCLGPGWSTVANTPFRRHKIWVHEGGISTPLIVQWPKRILTRNAWRHAVGHVVDLAPTILELAGGSNNRSAEAPPWPGQSLVPAIIGQASDPGPLRTIFFQHEGNRALRSGDWKIVAAKDEPWSLYNMAEDRTELRDIAPKEPGRLKQLAEEWERLREQYQQNAR